MRNYALCAAFALVLGTGAALADHAIEPDQAVEADHAIETNQAAETNQSAETNQAIETDRAVEAYQAVEAEAPDGDAVTYGVTREVCTVRDWGVGEVRRECLTEILPPRESDHAAKGVCMIKYGIRTCY
jgi:hypothetical protein